MQQTSILSPEPTISSEDVNADEMNLNIQRTRLEHSNTAKSEDIVINNTLVPPCLPVLAELISLIWQG
jgi:hypothetical protein